jgi:catechol 2,3-dioxygenase-like lactoylglutathione lyase family enzyme
MTIRTVFIQAHDVARSADFYANHLGGVVVSQTAERAVLDFVTASLDIRHLASGVPSAWQEDDINRGYRHIGFKVASVHDIAEGLRAEHVPFRTEPVFSEVGQVTLAFFFDPDGTVLEIVEGDLVYDTVMDHDLVVAERQMGVPACPRFDHVAHTVADVERAAAFFGPLGFQRMGTLFYGNGVGWTFDYLRGGGSVIELFSFDVPTSPSPRLVDGYGFLAVELSGPVPAGASVVGTLADGVEVYADACDLLFTIVQPAS